MAKTADETAKECRDLAAALTRLADALTAPKGAGKKK